LPSTIREGGIIRLLASFPNVKWLKTTRFENILENIENAPEFEGCAFHEQIRQAERSLRQLRGLTITHPLGYTDTVRHIVNLCPLLEELSLEVQDGMQLNSIANLRHLRRLEFRNSANVPASYLQEVQPLLKKVGQNLETLSLEEFAVIDLASCARLCPNLSAMSAQWFTILGCNKGSSLGMSKENREHLKRPFQSLRYLRLRPKSQHKVHPEAAQFLLSYAHYLEHCELYCCEELNDEHIKSITDTNGFSHLKKLIVRHGHDVSREAWHRLMNIAESLEYVDCRKPKLVKSELDDDDDHEEVNLLNVL
jgi:hypothetical protein